MILSALSRSLHRPALQGVRGLTTCLHRPAALSPLLQQNYSIHSPPSSPLSRGLGALTGVPSASFSRAAPLASVEGVAGSDYVRHWSAERVLALALLGTVPVAFVCPWQPFEYLATLSVVVHAHWGVEAIVHDYIRPKIFGSVIPKLSIAAVWFLSAFMLGGLFYFNYTDIGLVEAVKMTWRRV